MDLSLAGAWQVARRWDRLCLLLARGSFPHDKSSYLRSARFPEDVQAGRERPRVEKTCGAHGTSKKADRRTRKSRPVGEAPSQGGERSVQPISVAQPVSSVREITNYPNDFFTHAFFECGGRKTFLCPDVSFALE